MTPEEKAKAYDEAIKKATALYKTSEPMSGCNVIIETLFPELKESEDEKIRKALISVLTSDFEKDATIYGITVEEIIAWLEKQGDYANFRDKAQVGDRITKNEAGVLVNLSQLKRVAKPADKVELKFKVGDWLIFNEHHNRVYQVERIDNYRYYLRHYLGGTMSVHFDNELIRLWTIQDARDGDVLISKYGSMCIFKDNKSCYCYIDTKHETFYAKNNRWFSTDYTLKPATKEQRDTLMKAMTDAGYTFDFENKKLKKTEPKPKENKGNVGEFSSNWSEGDESIFESVIKDVMASHSNRTVEGFLCKLNWVKSIKDRVQVQPKQEWSEEDEEALEMAIIALEDMYDDDAPNTTYGGHYMPFDKAANQLKSLRPQNRWKPSDEQMMALLYHCSNGSVLSSLYNDLKKLKEE